MTYLEKLNDLDLRCDDEDQLFCYLSKFLRSLPIPLVDKPDNHEVLLLAQKLSEKAFNEAHKDVISLCILELWMYFPSAGPDKRHVEEMIRSLAHLSPTNLAADQLLTLTMIKYQDLVTDYQHLFCGGSKDLKLVELATKKLTALPAALETSFVVTSLQYKVSVYYLLCGSDHRKSIIYNYLQERGVLSAIVEKLPQFSALFHGDSLVTLRQYVNFVDYQRTNYYEFFHILKLHESVFFKNFLDCNINRLPRYYLSITFNRIQTLLCDDDLQFDPQDFLYDMVISNKLPQGTKIDQREKMVFFGAEQARYDELNTRGKKICDLVNSL